MNNKEKQGVAKDNLCYTAFSAQIEIHALFERVGIEVEEVCRDYGKETALLAWDSLSQQERKGISHAVNAYVITKIKNFPEDGGVVDEE